MHFSILTAFPQLYDSFLQTSLMKRAQESGEISFSLVNYMHMAAPKERIDAPTCGPGPGMLIKPTIVEKAINESEALHGKAFRIFFSPRGKKLDQLLLESLKPVLEHASHVQLVTARYEGFDVRTEERYADLILSVGDYVLMGGELPSMVFLESFARLIPHVIGNPASVEHDSFQGPFVDYPEYAECDVVNGQEVPQVLKSGNHKVIAQWRQEQQIERTLKGHFKWLREYPVLSNVQREDVYKKIPSHYAALMHDNVGLPNGRTGTSSVTTIDVHDGARSAKTYGLKGYFVVTSLVDQQIIVRTLLDFWAGAGKEYNPHRHEALQSTTIKNSLEDVIEAIERKEGKKPLLIATSAKHNQEAPRISYHDQALIWAQNRPVLLVFGTAQGLSSDFLKRMDYLLLPVEGFTDFNHLSVRSAMAVIFDRWLGLNPTISHKIDNSGL